MTQHERALAEGLRRQQARLKEAAVVAKPDPELAVLTDVEKAELYAEIYGGETFCDCGKEGCKGCDGEEDDEPDYSDYDPETAKWDKATAAWEERTGR